MQAYGSSFDRVIRNHVFLFQGQGAPAVGMGAQVRGVSPRSEAVWDCASDISGVDVRKLCQKGPMSRLMQTRFQQLAVTTVSTAMFEKLRESVDIDNAVFAGHSAGEYAALYAAGAFDLETLFKSVVVRATLMQEMAENSDGAMYVIKSIDRATLQRFIDGEAWQGAVQIANDNSPRQQVLSGGAGDLRALTAQLQRNGYSALKLPVNGAWHSDLMAPARSRLHEALKVLPIRTPARPVYMNITAAPVEEVGQIVDNLRDHLTQTVRWRETMEAVYREGYSEFVEVSTRKVLGGMLAHYEMGDRTKVSCFPDWC